MKPISRYFLLAVVVFVASASGFAQSNLETIFSNSYKSETAGKYPEAIKSLKEVYDEKSYEINMRLAYLSYMAGLFTESTTYYEKAISLMPYSVEAKFGYVLPAAALGNWDKVLNQYMEIVKIDPQNTKANYRIGSIYYGRKDYANAHKYLEKVVNLYPFDYDGLVLYAWANLQLGKMKEAKLLFEKVLLLSPRDKSALEGLSYIK
ncbi:MAG TPA: tetratricopeptide repeat protein [Chitinophagales bacterium]|nr:tetratricopeptide repeat protein [Chitinophagales bacterium]